MKLRTKQAIGFAIVVSLIIPAALVALYTFGEMHGEFEVLRDDVIPGAIAMAGMEQTLTRAHHHLMEYMVHGKEEDKELAQSGLEDLDKAGLEHLERERHIGPEERAAAKEMMAKVKKFASAVIGIIDLKDRSLSNAEFLQKEDETVHPAEAALIQQLREHRAVHMEELAQAERAVHQAHIAGTAVVLLATVCAVLVAAGAAFITSRMIVKPLQDLEKGTELIAQGDLDHRIGASGKDEIGQVARSFDRMTEHLSKTLVSKSALEEANAALTSEMTERKRAQEHLRITLASIGDAVIAVDTDRRVVNLNGAAEQLTGWTFQEARGRPLEEVFHIINEETRKPAPDPVARVIASGQIQGLANHTVLIARDGTERAIADSAAPIQDAAGTTVGVVLVFRDITEERQRRKEREQLLHDMGERIKELNCLYGLSRIVEKPGMTLEGILQETAQLLPPSWQYPEIASSRIRFEGRIFETDACPQGPWCQSSDIKVNGRKVGSVEVCYREARSEADEGPFVKEERAMINAVAGRLGRIIERKRAEQELRRSESKYRILLENLPQRIFSKDRDSVYISCNENFARVLGIRLDEFAGKTDYDFFPKEMAEKYRADDKRVMESGQTETIEERFIEDGREMTVQTVKTPIKDEKGNPVGVLGIFWDITERRRAEEESQYRLQELERFNRLAVGREQRMIELKREVDEMARKAGVAPPYDLAFAESGKGGIDDDL